MARLFPQWLILGMDDKSGGPVQDQRKVPKNFKYIRCYYDLLITLHDIPENSFDLVFARFLIFSYGEEDYVELIKQCERICKPGGYVELYELDMRIYGNPEVGPMTHKLNGKGKERDLVFWWVEGGLANTTHNSI
jgi:ubiquinone/menaquinone biosynthesis C-methylase UbiE